MSFFYKFDLNLTVITNFNLNLVIPLLHFDPFLFYALYKQARDDHISRMRGEIDRDRAELALQRTENLERSKKIEELESDIAKRDHKERIRQFHVHQKREKIQKIKMETKRLKSEMEELKAKRVKQQKEDIEENQERSKLIGCITDLFGKVGLQFINLTAFGVTSIKLSNTVC